MFRRGFSLLEVVIVIGIVGVMSALSVPAYRDYQIRSDLDKVAQQVSQGLARAQLLSKSGERDAMWGFYVPAGVLYKGTSYATRDSSFDQVYPMPSTIAVSGLMDISYSRVKGTASQEGNIVLRALNDDQRQIQVTIAVDAQTIATNTGDVLTICHHPGLPDQQTMTVPDATWPMHIAHGDTVGACAGASSSAAVSSSSSAPASSSSSSVPASSSSSSSSSSAAGSCSKFTMNSSQLITLTANSSVTFVNKLAQITFGSGGPDIPVHVCYSKNNGSSFSGLFGGSGNCTGNGNAYGNAVEPDGTNTATKSLSSGDRLILKIAGRYKTGGWLAFNETFTSNNSGGHTLFLRNGDILGSFPGFGSQIPLKTYLQGQGLANASGQITMTNCQVLAVTELGDLNTSASDFQDDVLLMTFN